MSIDATETPGYDETEDPWATGTSEPPAEDATGEFDEFDDILSGMEEVESDEPIIAPSSARRYTNPYDVGLKNMQWVPIRILSAMVDPKKVPRLSSKTCVAKMQVPDPETGEMKTKRLFLFDQIEEALKKGATEEQVDAQPLPYFVCTANHASSEYQRTYDWEIEVPVFSIKTALFRQQGNGRTGYKNESGRSLRVAAGATSSGETVTAKNPAPEGQINMHDVAARMEEKIVLAQLNIVQGKNPRYRQFLDENNQTISVQLDPETGGQVTLLKPDADSSYVYDDGTGRIWEGDEKTLVAIPGTANQFAIRDNSGGEGTGPLQEKYFPINDYLKTTFLPLPERKIEVETLDGSTVEGEITLETIGAIAQGNVVGAQVDVFLKTGKKVTAVWLGTQWNEKEPDSGVEGGLDHFAGSKDPVSTL